jgi:hypothetical protein
MSRILTALLLVVSVSETLRTLTLALTDGRRPLTPEQRAAAMALLTGASEHAGRQSGACVGPGGGRSYAVCPQ